MIMQAKDKKYYTAEEYLELELDSAERHEYLDGEIATMTGGTPNHNQIALNLSGTLNLTLRRQPYRVFVADQRLWIPRKKIYTYPDVMVIQGELQFQEGRRDTITNPLIIAEVLSGSTRNYDKDAKFSAYRTIPGFQEYLLIDQYTLHIEQYFKTDQKRWTFSEYDEADEIVSFNSIPFQMPLADIYDKVVFEEIGNG
ncbi:Uma2 family endonuclease [Leptolyngbya sp. FACHB-261]|uniref:Uma2 family endonuclease n=1 Tax=Leptolyngbya sp. FACHB-261 TaxID=2692806 RepID=UPI0016847DCA|nr:Uma2 family endonuclease [Leptolyngbya sp. FACHB-261]MBD2099786.1 Uma2 family endonuclease [Leptolyngbya sp. FACHB-261]